MNSWQKILSSLQAQVLVRCNWRLEVPYEEELKPRTKMIATFPGTVSFGNIQDCVNTRVQLFQQDHHAQMQAYRQKKCAEAAAAAAVAAAAEAAEQPRVGRKSASSHGQQDQAKNGAWPSTDVYVDAMEGQGDSQ